jgi:hypothetical protein
LRLFPKAGGFLRANLVAVNRYIQIAIWVFLAPVFGAIQSVASFSFLILHHGDLGNSDLHCVLKGVALIYGGGWFIPALVISDLFLVRRTLSGRDLARYILSIAVTALLVGLLMQGMLLMIGYPITALAIVACGFLHRRKQDALQVGVDKLRPARAGTLERHPQVHERGTED